MMRLENARHEEKIKKEFFNQGGKVSSKWSQRSNGNLRSASQSDLTCYNNINVSLNNNFR